LQVLGQHEQESRAVEVPKPALELIRVPPTLEVLPTNAADLLDLACSRAAVLVRQCLLERERLVPLVHHVPIERIRASDGIAKDDHESLVRGGQHL
jgi:hypothetical protein